MQEVRGELGAALRSARARRALLAALAAPRELGARVRGRRPRAAVAVLVALVAAAALTAIALYPQRAPDDEPAGGAPAAAVGTTAAPTLLRGRSQTAVPIVVAPTAPPTAQPTGQVSAPTGVPGGAGSGGAGPATVEKTRFQGRVIDRRSGTGIPGVCVVLGVRECSENPIYTDGEGEFAVDLPSGSTWDMTFTHASFATERRKVASTRFESLVLMGNIGLGPK